LEIPIIENDSINSIHYQMQNNETMIDQKIIYHSIS